MAEEVVYKVDFLNQWLDKRVLPTLGHAYKSAAIMAVIPGESGGFFYRSVGGGGGMDDGLQKAAVLTILQIVTNNRGPGGPFKGSCSVEEENWSIDPRGVERVVPLVSELFEDFMIVVASGDSNPYFLYYAHNGKSIPQLVALLQARISGCL
jgi:hypothetical protein